MKNLIEKAKAQAEAISGRTVLVKDERRVIVTPGQPPRYFFGKRKVSLNRFLSKAVSPERQDIDVILDRPWVQSVVMLTNGAIEVQLTENYVFDDLQGSCRREDDRSIYRDTAEARCLSERCHVSRIKPA